MIIGIAGGSGSGKSTLAEMIAKRLGAGIISLDSYFKDPDTFPIVYGHRDHDRLEAVDFDKCIRTIRSHKGPLVVEGFLILAHPEMRKLFDVSFFIDTGPDTLAKRRIARDPDVNPEYIISHVQTRYQRLVLPTKEYADQVLDGNLSIATIYEVAWSYLRTKGFVPSTN